MHDIFGKPSIVNLLLLLLFLLVGCVSSPPTPTPIPTPAPTPIPPPPFRIIGYITDDVIVETLPFDRVTHLNYAFATPNDDGSFNGVLNGWKLKKVVELAHAQTVQVLLSVGGWGYDSQFEQLAANPETRAVFVSGLVAYYHEYELDGLDIDWEYPDPGPSADNFLALMSELRAALPAGALLTAAVVAQGGTGEGILDSVFPLLDFINIMAYDASNGDHSPYSYAETSLAYWQGRGLPAEKTVLGVPFYARPGWAPYRNLVQNDPAAANNDTTSYNGQLVYYNGQLTIQQKTQLALDNASGIMIWTLTYDTTDDTSLLQTIWSTVHN